MTTTEVAPCPKCGHSAAEHRRESWYDEEGIEGMTCAACEAQRKDCRWWTWDWAEVLSGEAEHSGDEPTEVDTIRARLASATPGPWRLKKTDWWVVVSAQDEIVSDLSDVTDADAGLIANAPADIAALLAEVDRLRAANQQLGDFIVRRGLAADLDATTDRT